MKVSVIIPMYNESGIIAQSAQSLSDYMKDNFESYEIIFCDDGSSDGTREIVEKMELPCARVIGYANNKGKGSAVRHAILAADGDVRIFTDADLAYGTCVIKRAVETFAKAPDADVLIGSRNICSDGYEGYTFTRKIMSRIYIKILCVIGGFKLSDSQCGFKGFTKQAAERIFSSCTVDGFAFDFETILEALRQGQKIVEMPVKIINHRESSVRPLSDSIKMIKDLRRIKRNVEKRSSTKK